MCNKEYILFTYFFIFIFIITIFKDINTNGKCLSLLSLLYGIKNVYLLCCLCLHKTAYYHFLNQVALTSLFLLWISLSYLFSSTFVCGILMIASEIFIWIQYHPDALRSAQLLTFNLSYLIVLTYGSDILKKIES